MNFVSVQFAIFFVLVFCVYWRLPHRWQSAFLLLASWAFYAAWDWRFLGLIVTSTAVDFIAGRRIHRSTSRVGRRGWLWFSLIVNLGILGCFKYAGFFVDSLVGLASAVGWHLSSPTLQIILPVGISFYTFQTLSYTIDIYLGRLEPTRSIVDFGAFVAFFPQLVAGPIVRAREFLYQLETPRRFAFGTFEGGAIRFLEGLVLKAVVADVLAVQLVDPVFADPGSYGASALWLGVVGYTAQIYADFCGYSSMAIGAAAMLGFSIPENFRFPYLSRSYSEFWSRWHMTMSRFFRDYVYIPLGGSRGSPARTRWNLAVTTLVSGLWHGASWTFVAWGGLHGVFIMIGHALRGSRIDRSRVAGALGWVTTLLGVMLAWILFRAQSFGEARTYVLGLFGAEGSSVTVGALPALAIGAVFLHHVGGWVLERPEASWARVPAFVRAAACLALIVFVQHAMPEHANPFIYFQF